MNKNALSPARYVALVFLCLAPLSFVAPLATAAVSLEAEEVALSL